MRLLCVLLLLSSAPLVAQTWIAPYLVGEYRNDVVYEGVYNSPGNCTWSDGTDFIFNFSGISFPTGIDLALVIDAPDPSGITLMNGWAPVNVGDSITFTPETNGLGISAVSGPATIRFHIRAVGTPNVEGENYSCWITEGVTEAVCNNVYSLLTGESLAPCEVELPTDMDNSEPSLFTINVQDGRVVFRSDVSGMLELVDMAGRVLHSERVSQGAHHVFSVSSSGILIARLTDAERTFSRKIFIR
jgi:hypothetical protein